MTGRATPTAPVDALASITVRVPADQPQTPMPTVIEQLRSQLLQALTWMAAQPNTEALWGTGRQQIEDSLLVSWQDGELSGTTAEQAFFVRCNRTTMSQNDLDNGRLIALLGVATAEPGEFTLLEITQQARRPDEPAARRLFPTAPLRSRTRQPTFRG
jgi:hypothetical protein